MKCNPGGRAIFSWYIGVLWAFLCFLQGVFLLVFIVFCVTKEDQKVTHNNLKKKSLIVKTRKKITNIRRYLGNDGIMWNIQSQITSFFISLLLNDYSIAIVLFFPLNNNISINIWKFFISDGHIDDNFWEKLGWQKSL